MCARRLEISELVVLAPLRCYKMFPNLVTQSELLLVDQGFVACCSCWGYHSWTRGQHSLVETAPRVGCCTVLRWAKLLMCSMWEARPQVGGSTGRVPVTLVLETVVMMICVMSVQLQW